MSIEKKIHYCWFGGKEKPKYIQKILNTWNIMDGYEIIEWNEKNININEHKYMEENYKLGKFAFVSDYVRLKVLYEYGGIYLDTDVEIFKKFSDEFLESDMFLSFMFDCNLSTAIIGAKKNNKTIKKLLEIYDNYNLNDSPNNDLFTKFMLENYKEFKLNNKHQKLEDKITIYPKEFFECGNKFYKDGYSMHHFDNSWKEKNNIKSLAKKIIKVVFGDLAYHKNMRKRAIKKSPFYNIYCEHIKN